MICIGTKINKPNSFIILNAYDISNLKIIIETTKIQGKKIM